MLPTSKPQPLQSLGLPKVEQILGLAVFDSMGLPRSSFITPKHQDTDWVQLVFQFLGLQQLMASTMGLPMGGHIMVRTKIGNIVVIRRDHGYVALLLKRALPQERPEINSDWVDWICDFEANVVRNDANFQAV